MQEILDSLDEKTLFISMSDYGKTEEEGNFNCDSFV